jgi:hypothetical protein
MVAVHLQNARSIKREMLCTANRFRRLFEGQVTVTERQYAPILRALRVGPKELTHRQPSQAHNSPYEAVLKELGWIKVRK